MGDPKWGERVPSTGWHRHAHCFLLFSSPGVWPGTAHWMEEVTPLGVPRADPHLTAPFPSPREGAPSSLAPT